MKVKRYKKVNKHLNFYINNLGFRQPYQILVDGTFCLAALKNKINITDDLPRYLQGQLKLLTTQCAIIEMENLGGKLSGALVILKKYGIHKCGHEGKPIVASRCFLSMVRQKNPNHYFIATQDRDLQDKVRGSFGVPLLYLHGKTPVFEEPSDVTVRALKNKIAGVTAFESEQIEQLKKDSGFVDSVEQRPRKKKLRGPNPLSCLKKKNKKVQQQGKVVKDAESKAEVEKKKRKKIRIPQHVKEELLKNKTDC